MKMKNILLIILGICFINSEIYCGSKEILLRTKNLLLIPNSLAIGHLAYKHLNPNDKTKEIDSILSIFGMIFGVAGIVSEPFVASMKENLPVNKKLIFVADGILKIYFTYISYLYYLNNGSKLHGKIGLLLGAIATVFWGYIAYKIDNYYSDQENFRNLCWINSLTNCFNTIVSSIMLIKS